MEKRFVVLYNQSNILVTPIIEVKNNTILAISKYLIQSSFYTREDAINFIKDNLNYEKHKDELD